MGYLTEYLTCNVCNLIVLISPLKVGDDYWTSSLEDRAKFLCYPCYNKAPEDKKYRIAPHQLKNKQEDEVLIEEEDPYESLRVGEHEEKYKSSVEIEHQSPV